MRIDEAKHIYLIGIGGIGMSALARYFKHHGRQVAGYDKTRTELTDSLASEGISIHYEDDVEQIPSTWTAADTLVVLTPAVPTDHTELQHLLEHGFEVKKRAEVLGELTRDQFTIAVAGTHGKTTTSTIIAHLLQVAGYECNAFLGGISANYQTNILLNERARAMVVEADEYDRSFLTLHPDIAVVTSAEPDHLDIYGDEQGLLTSFQEFADLSKQGRLIRYDTVVLDHPSAVTYGSEQDDLWADHIRVEDGYFMFDAVTPKGRIEAIRFPMPGRHNIMNAMAGIAVAQELGLDNDVVKAGLESFAGVQRRFEFQVRTPEMVYIDDYAHHPSEIDACISAVKELYPEKRITGVFQPHLYTRTRDFADGFASSLSALNEVVLLDIYPARELPIEGVTSADLLTRIDCDTKEVASKAELVDILGKRELEVLVTLGAGDIDQLVAPLKQMLEKRVA